MNILLVCAAGMSTSLLVSKMEKTAKAESKDYHIQAVSADQAKKHIEQADVLLLGPQVRYMLSQMKKLGEERGIPVDVINSVDYGTGNGKNVLHYAESLFAKKG
ncbi:PTS system, cellobiose-specific IIB component [Terribacillus halophilus]|uniref:PTS system, cellobiose-specific IIB component n=1 Tax=Terribacillus halophilus TaxID=361279 RepID=A0A1G6IUH7_9BACI|nr:PTS sugar transporter subunit IIB [Terribacillus halophilus]SDC09426.1 PTS system, cellobiose-specific IIB component [Terribacillus halophilus]